jgi:hypothetical protein
MRLSAVGDVVNTLPTVSATRAAFPEARIGYLVEDKAKEVVEGHPDLDEVTVFPNKRWRGRALSPTTWSEAAGHVRRIRDGEYDVLLDFQGNLKGGLHAALSGIPTRIGFARGHSREGSHRFTNVHVAPPSERMLRAQKFLTLLRPEPAGCAIAAEAVGGSCSCWRRWRAWSWSASCGPARPSLTPSLPDGDRRQHSVTPENAQRPAASRAPLFPWPAPV